MKKTNSIITMQPYMIMATKDYCRKIADDDLGISHFYQVDFSDNGEKNFDAVPDGCIDLVFSFDDSGIHTSIGGTVYNAKPWKLGEISSCFGVRFNPGNVIMPNDLTPEMLVDNDYDIDGNMFGEDLEEKLLFRTSLEERADIFTKAYRKMVEANADDNMGKNVEEYVKDRIYNTLGTVSMSELVNETGYSECYIRRLFKKYNGISPKLFSQYVRFQTLLKELKENEDVSCELLAQECGYYDEAHMMKEFKKYTGVTVEKFRKMILPKKYLM